MCRFGRGLYLAGSEFALQFDAMPTCSLDNTGVSGDQFTTVGVDEEELLFDPNSGWGVSV